MLRSLQRLLKGLVEDSGGPASAPELQVLSGALFAQLAAVDHEIHGTETDTIRSLLQRTFSLGPEEIDEILEQVARQVEKSTSLFEFTSHINRSCNPQEKYRIVRGLWEIAFADGRLDKYEEHFVRRAAELLHVHHEDFIRAKLEARRDGPPSG